MQKVNKMFEMNKIELANQELKKVRKFLEKNQDAFDLVNLKLYNAFYYAGSEEMEKDFPLCSKNNHAWFSDFCDINYNIFVEDLKECYNINFSNICHQLDGTSNFYLHDNTLIYIDDFGIDYDETSYMFINKYNKNGRGLFANIENGKIEVNNDYLNAIRNYEKRVENEIDYIINNFYNDFTEYCNDIIIVYTLIRDFHDNQVTYFKDYLECEEENLEAEEELKKENQLKSVAVCMDIMKKYNITFEDMEALKENINEF